MAWNRKRAYFALMGTCIGLFVLAGAVVRFWSVPVAIAMCVVAAVIPPVAAMVGNFGELSGRDRISFEEKVDNDERREGGRRPSGDRPDPTEGIEDR